MSEPRIVSAAITFPDRDRTLTELVLTDPGDESTFKATVTAIFSDGTTGRVLAYYENELGFTPEEFTGLTQQEVNDLFHQRDVAYLQS